MNILIVGGAGYVGGGIVDKLKKHHQVTVYDSLIYEESYRKDVNFVYGDSENILDFVPGGAIPSGLGGFLAFGGRE